MIRLEGVFDHPAWSSRTNPPTDPYKWAILTQLPLVNSTLCRVLHLQRNDEQTQAGFVL